MDSSFKELESLLKESEGAKDEKLAEKEAKGDRKKTVEVSQRSLKTFSQIRKRRYEEGETAQTKSKKNDVLITNLSQKNGIESRLKEKKF